MYVTLWEARKFGTSFALSDPLFYDNSFLDRVVVLVAWILVTSDKHVSSVREYFHFMTTHFLDRVVVIVTCIIVTPNRHVSSITIVNYSVHLTQPFYQR